MANRDIGIDQVVKERLDAYLVAVEEQLDRDVVTVVGALVHGIDDRFRSALEDFPTRRKSVAIIVDTWGGVVEVVERMVETVRHLYDDVTFIIPDKAMSAGTIFAMSGDRIMMDYFSRLGPIDPQVEKDGKLVPALSYLVQYRRLLKKDREGRLTSAEYALLDKLDLAELHQYEQARNLSITLLRKWLATYKFKNWTVTQGSKTLVTSEMREHRAEEIAKALSDNELWHSHGRGISRETLESDAIKLQIDDLAENGDLHDAIWGYYTCLRDFIRHYQMTTFVHTRWYY